MPGAGLAGGVDDPMDDKITALQKRVDELEAAQKTAEKSEK